MSSDRKPESRRQPATPSIPSTRKAARDEREIAAENWDEARRSDEDSPRPH